jgi:heme-degrading monooxygenase HmoA
VNLFDKFDPFNIKHRKKLLEEQKHHAQKIARQAKAITEMPGYQGFRLWAKTVTTPQKPVFKTKDEVDAWCANQLVAAGIKHAAQYFDLVQDAPKEILGELAIIEAEEKAIEEI